MPKEEKNERKVHETKRSLSRHRLDTATMKIFKTKSQSVSHRKSKCDFCLFIWHVYWFCARLRISCVLLRVWWKSGVHIKIITTERHKYQFYNIISMLRMQVKTDTCGMCALCCVRVSQCSVGSEIGKMATENRCSTNTNRIQNKHTNIHEMSNRKEWK